MSTGLRVRHLFFDLDGTLSDSREGIVRCLVHALEVLGRTSPGDDQLARRIGPPLQRLFAELLGCDDPVFIARAVAAYRERYSTVGIFENRLFPGVLDALDLLAAAGRELYIVTSKPQVFTDRVMDHFELRSRFRKVIGADLEGRRADKTFLVGRLLAEEMLEGREVVVIGDRDVEIVAAKKYGAGSVGVTWGNGSREELEAAGADAIVDSVGELARRLGAT